MVNDLSDRIMGQVAVTRIHEPVKVKAVIGKPGWILIASGLLLTLCLFTIFSANSSQGPLVLGTILQQLPRVERDLHLPTGDQAIWPACVAALLLIITLMDRVVQRAVR